MAKRQAIKPKKSLPRRRNICSSPTLRLGVSIPTKTVTNIDKIASYFGVSRSYIVSILLDEPVSITAARIDEFGAHAADVSEAMTRAILGTEENQMDLMLDDRLKLLQEALSGRNL